MRVEPIYARKKTKLYLFRNLFATSSNNATDLALVVQYIRRELQALEQYGGENLNAGIVKFDKPDATFV